MKSGFVALVGRPNVGKSTLLNSIVGKKVAITSDKPQTTRNIIQGIYNEDDLQIVFVDTPGIHKPNHKLGTYLNRALAPELSAEVKKAYNARSSANSRIVECSLFSNSSQNIIKLFVSALSYILLFTVINSGSVLTWSITG